MDVAPKKRAKPVVAFRAAASARRRPTYPTTNPKFQRTASRYSHRDFRRPFRRILRRGMWSAAMCAERSTPTSLEALVKRLLLGALVAGSMFHGVPAAHATCVHA